jgi:protein phosphatase PTC2/3
MFDNAEEDKDLESQVSKGSSTTAQDSSDESKEGTAKSSEKEGSDDSKIAPEAAAVKPLEKKLDATEEG